MPQNVQYRDGAKIVGWVHFIMAIVAFIGSIILIGSTSFALTTPEILDTVEILAPNTKESFTAALVYALVYYCVSSILCIFDMWISKGLIFATNMETDIVDALRLGKRYIIGSAVICIADALLLFVCWGIIYGGFYAGLSAAIRGLLSFVVYRYVQSLQQPVSNVNVQFVAQKVEC